MSEASYRCPHDGGKCHHGCARRLGPTDCDRKRHNMSLTKPWAGFPVAGNQPVLAEMDGDGLRMLEQAKAHMENVPPSGTPWPEAVAPKYERLISIGGCPETLSAQHVVEAGDSTCILCFQKFGGLVLRRPIRESIPAQTPPACAAQMVSVPAGKADLDRDGLPIGYATPVTEEPWSL